MGKHEEAAADDVEAICTRALREGRHEGIGAVLRALSTCAEPAARQAQKWLCTKGGEAAIERELERADEERAIGVMRGQRR